MPGLRSAALHLHSESLCLFLTLQAIHCFSVNCQSILHASVARVHHVSRRYCPNEIELNVSVIFGVFSVHHAELVVPLI
jgi:hypothetical protein